MFSISLSSASIPSRRALSLSVAIKVTVSALETEGSRMNALMYPGTCFNFSIGMAIKSTLIVPPKTMIAPFNDQNIMMFPP